ncbi:MAG: Thiol peroxidase, Bcp-type [Myxococcales bacterium]|nr:Thiol peroxidase, Bcp-type [Myxococcales bacterium]
MKILGFGFMDDVMNRIGFAFAVVVSLVGVSACKHGGASAPTPAADDLLPVGSPAPDFIATAHDGSKVHLVELRGHDVVLYFYPKDDTTGCTKEACNFRDAWSRLQSAGVVVLGVSTQDNISHTEFAQKYRLPFPLIPDEHGELAAKYHVPMFVGLTRRVTYLIDKDGRIKHAWPKVNPEKHAEDILAQLGG